VYFVLVAYDIADPKRLRQIASIMEQAGVRVQKSVFECGLSPDALLALKGRIQRSIDPAEDSVLLQPLPTHCRAGITWQGKGPGAHTEPFWIV
jgi:CRISPR-associated protein Cas2